MPSEARGDIDLKARCTSSTRALQLEYLVENVSQSAVFVFNILHDHIAENGIYPLLTGAYVELEPEAVVVSRKLFPVPELTLVEHRNIPFVTRLLPQARIHERIELTLPLRPFDPYRSFEDEELLQWARKPLVFELGYFVERPAPRELGRSFPTDHGPRPGFEVFTSQRKSFFERARLVPSPSRRRQKNKIRSNRHIVPQDIVGTRG